jgi:hypothetical protein
MEAALRCQSAALGPALRPIGKTPASYRLRSSDSRPQTQSQLDAEEAKWSATLLTRRPGEIVRILKFMCDRSRHAQDVMLHLIEQTEHSLGFRGEGRRGSRMPISMGASLRCSRSCMLSENEAESASGTSISSHKGPAWFGFGAGRDLPRPTHDAW